MIDIPTGKQVLRDSDALQAGLDYLRDRARSRAPVLKGRLRDSIQTRRTSETSGDIYTGLIYAPKQERRTWQKHPHGGQAHYLSETFLTDGDGAFEAVAKAMHLGE